MNNIEFIAKRITELRLRNNISSRKLSLDLGLSNSYITQIENGNKVPSIENLIKICDYFKITIADFFSASQIPDELNELLDNAKELTSEQLELLSKFIKSMK